MRITPTKLLNVLTFLILFVLLWTVFMSSNEGTKSEYNDTCYKPKQYRTSLHDLVYQSHSVLDSLSLTHFLCYGSLFGQVRRAANLPWEKDAEMCVFDEEVSQHDEVFIKRAFGNVGLEATYDSGEGLYVITVANDAEKRKRLQVQFPIDFTGYLQLIVFSTDKQIVVDGETMRHRVGWKRRLLPPDCEYSSTLDCYPKRLSESPLPLKRFGNAVAPVPKEEFEILKYHFPNNWWREERPLNC